MALALLPDEKKVIEAALAFANLRNIRSASRVERLFVGIRARIMLRRADGGAVYREQQRQLRSWLDFIVGDPQRPRDRQRVEKALAPLLREAVPVRIQFRDRQLSYTFIIQTPEAGYAWAVALLLDRKIGLTNRLQQCGLSTCGRFNLDFTPRGRPRRFCNAEHKKKFDLERWAASKKARDPSRRAFQQGKR